MNIVNGYLSLLRGYGITIPEAPDFVREEYVSAVGLYCYDSFNLMVSSQIVLFKSRDEAIDYIEYVVDVPSCANAFLIMWGLGVGTDDDAQPDIIKYYCPTGPYKRMELMATINYWLFPC